MKEIKTTEIRSTRKSAGCTIFDKKKKRTHLKRSTIVNHVVNFLNEDRSKWKNNAAGIITYRPGVANLRLFEKLFVALDKCTRFPFSFLCYYILKNYYRSVCVSKCLLNYWQLIWKTKFNKVHFHPS